MEVTANLYHYRSSSLKVRLATQFVRGLPVAKAQAQLQFSPRAAAKPILKLLNSAIANAEHNHKMSTEGLYIKELLVTEGATLKRFRPRAFGRAGTIRKRTVHVTLVLADRNAGKTKEKVATAKVAKTAEASHPKTTAKPDAAKKSTAKAADKKPAVT
ncbi:MAG: 50S ribosomal protein L22 [Patescibacteria group bacterium]|jgi:large subunit ribosomal protein L22